MLRSRGARAGGGLRGEDEAAEDLGHDEADREHRDVGREAARDEAERHADPDGRIAFVRSDNFFGRAKVETLIHAVRPDGSAGC